MAIPITITDPPTIATTARRAWRTSIGPPADSQIHRTGSVYSKALRPVTSRPIVNRWMSSVPSYVFTVSRFSM